jgi:hypothetical protein
MYSFAGASTNLATFTAEDNLIKTYPPCLVPGSFFKALGDMSSSLKISVRGQVGTTGTPTYTFSLRLISGNPTWSAGGLLLGTSGAVPGASTVLLAPWELDCDVVLRALGAGGGTHTVVTMGTIAGAGFSSAGSIPANNTGVTLATIDPSATYSLFLSVACSASNALNLINTQVMKVYGEN